MTARGFWVVPALSSHTSGRPLTSSLRIGKSRLIAETSKRRMRVGRDQPAVSAPAQSRNSARGCCQVGLDSGHAFVETSRAL